MNILVPVDFSEITPRLIETALDQAEGRDARLFLLHVVPPEPTFVGYEPGPATVREELARHIRSNRQELQSLAESIEASGLPVTARFMQGATAESILAAAEDADADLIIMGTHGHGLVYQMLIGSVSEAVLRHATRPLLLVPARSLKAAAN